MNCVTIRLDIHPRPKKGGKGKGEVFKEAADGLSYWDALCHARMLAEAHLKRKRWEPVPRHVPVLVTMDMVFARYTKRRTWCPKSVWESGERFLRPVRPDVDNCAGFVLDALQAPKGSRPYAYYDDGQVVPGSWRRWVAAEGERAHILVRMERLDMFGRTQLEQPPIVESRRSA
jgi:Holliday junction resolvase RusA-like endonuclease